MKLSARAKAIILAVLLGIGLLNGLAQRERQNAPHATAAAPQPAATNPAETMALLFEEFCIGALRQMSPDPQGQLVRKVVDGAPRWVDEATGMSLFLGYVPPKTCTIADDVQPLTPAQKANFTQIVAQNMPRWAPQLIRRDPPNEGAVLLHAWVPGQGASWGITLRQNTAQGPTLLTLRQPSN